MSESAEIPQVSFDEKSVLEEATRRTGGLSDFGDESFREPMRALLRALETDSGMNAVGRYAQWERIVGLLVNRLRTEDWIARHPEILEEEIREPVVIVGLMRTGTTMLHRLIASDPGMNAVLWFESRNPAPFPDTVWGQPDPRIADAEEQVRVVLETQPDLASIHPWDPIAPDEDVMVREHSFMSGVPESFTDVRSYGEWLTQHDHASSYAYLKRLLLFLQWQKRQAGVCGDRWVLKTPDHMGYLDELFAAFPDASIIQTHRDPVETIPSMASMNYALWSMAMDDPDPVEVGRQWARKVRNALYRLMEARETLPAERFVDVWFRDVLKDPMAELRRIYAAVGRELTPEAERGMRGWVEKNPREGRPPHEYTLEKFGYTEEWLKEYFAEYRERFILPRQGGD